MTFNQKETSFLQELKSQEQVCVDKYNRYAANACDHQLKTLFTQIAATEQGHLDTINQMISGTVPSMSSGNKSQQKPLDYSMPTYTNCSNQEAKKNDCYLCSDALATEKHVAGVYNTGIFEFTNSDARNVLNHIQKEEQEHGKQIYDYMAANGMYQA